MDFSIVTGNGFVGNAQRYIDDSGTYDGGIYSDTFYFTPNLNYTLSFKYRTNVGINVIEYEAAGSYNDFFSTLSNTGNCETYTGVCFTTFSNRGLGFQIQKYNNSSSSSITIPTSHPTSKTLTTGLGLNYCSGLTLNIYYNSSNFFICSVTSYNPSNGNLVVSSISNVGSGTYTTWSVNYYSGGWFEIDEINITTNKNCVILSNIYAII